MTGHGEIVEDKAGIGASRVQQLRIIEALIFTSAEPVSGEQLLAQLPEGTDLAGLLSDLQRLYAQRGVNLVAVAGKWTFRTAPDLAPLLRGEVIERRKLSRAAMETLGIIAYHQPVTRAEIEEIRGVSLSKGTLDTLMEIGWIKLRGRRRTPGRPVTYGTTEAFLLHFGLESLGDLPGDAELRAAGLLDGNLPADFSVPVPGENNRDLEEDPLEDDFEPPLEIDLPDGDEA